MKKFFSLLLALTLVVGMLSAFTASAAVNTTVFYDASTNEQITSLDNVESIYATTTFTGRYEDNASVIVSHYGANGKLVKVEPIVPVTSTIGESVSYTTPEISVADTEILKVFAWTGVDTIKPLLKFPGVICRTEAIPLPTATVTELDVAEITAVPLTFAMNFKADPVTQAQLLAYGNWYADYELKINKDVTFNLDGTKDGYLAGQYDSWSPAWVQVPKKDVTLAANTPLKIMETGAQTYGKPGLKYTCQEVFDRVKDFDCGVFFSDEFLAANPDIYVTLELRIYNPLNESESYLINSETYEFGKIPGTPEPVDYTNAPYAGVYQVTSDKAVTLTNETGHTVTLAAGETKYFYLIKGNNDVTGIGDANVTFTALEGNGMDYLAEVAITKVPLTANRYYIGRPDDGQNIGSYVVSKDDNVVNNTSNVTIPVGASVVINVPVPADNAGIYSFGIYTTQKTSAIFRLETDTGYYGDLLLDGGNFTEISADSIATGSQIDLEQAYLREGDNHVTITNNGYSDVSLSYVRIYKTAQLESLADYNWALNYNYFKVVIADGEEPEVTPTPVPTETPAPTPEPTPEATPDVPAVESVDYTNAPYAGVYMVTSDKAVTLTNETGHTATLAAGVPGYFYLIKGNNNIAGIDGATLTITAIAGNGMDYYSQVNAGSVAISTATTYFGPAGEGSHIGEYYVASENGTCTVGTDYVIIPAGATAIVRGNLKGSAGIYYVTLFLEKISGGTITVESDTGYYGEYLPTAINWTTFGTESASDLEVFYLRDGANTIKVTNNGSDYITLTGVKLARTNNVGVYADQLNIASCKVVPYVAEANKVTTEATVLTSKNVTAEVPAGVLLNKGVTELTLTTTALENSESGVEAGANETLSAMDVHVEGVSEENTTPIIVTLKEATDKGYNKGNLSLFHVEDGVAVPMEEVETKADLVKHNQFTYDPADGTIAVALANFSEIALLATNDKVWNGEYDYSWYSADKNTFEIANADQMAGFSAIVGGMNGQTEDTFLGKTVKLIADLDFGGVAVAEPNDQPGDVFYPVGYYNTEGTYPKSGTAITSGMKPFEGTFDGNGHTIANIFQTTWIMKGDHEWYDAKDQHYRDGMGIFGKVYGGTIKNLTVDNFISVGEITTTGVIASYAESWNGRNAVFENIALTNCNPQVYNIGNGGIVGSGGWYSRAATDIANTPIIFRNITVDNTNKISALWGSWDVACAGIMGRYYPDSNCGVSFENCHVAAQIDVYNDVCGNYQYYWYRYAGMMIGTVEKSTTDEKGYTVPDLTGITAKDCTVHFGDWNNYYYCEMVVNSLASYTHDHQFSRLTEVDSVDVDAMTVTVDGKTTAIPTSGRVNYVVVNGNHATENATCYHFVDGAVWNHEDAGYETSIDENGDGQPDLKEDKQHVYLPFNQLFQGDGWGVKNIPVYNGEDYAFEGITILDRQEANSVEKFESKHVASVNTGTSLTVGDLFKVVDNGVDVVTENVQVAVSPVIYDGNTANATINVNDDWTKSTINFTGYGKVEITITDYYFCTPTTIVVDVEDTLPSIIDDGEAFVKHVAECGGMIALPNAGSNMITVHTADNDGWFSFKIGVPEDDTYVLQAILLDTNEYGKVYGNGITFTHTDGRELAIPNSNNEVVLIAGNWHTIGEITLEEGNHTFIVENNDTANGYSFWGIRLVKPEDLVVDKFEGTTVNKQLVYGKDGKTTATVTLGDLFTAMEGAEIDSANVTVTANGATVAKADDWKQTTLTYTAAGEYTVTINDGDNCIPANATVNVSAAAKVDKWTGGKTANAKLAYGANSVEVNFSDLFTDNGYTKGTITVTGGTYNASTGKVTVSCTDAGDYKVTITDNSGYCNVAESTVRVAAADPIDKFTGTTATVQHTLATLNAKAVSVKLGDIFTGTNVVTGNITVTIAGKATTVKASDWANATITVPGGVNETVTITINDNNLCNTATGYVKLTAPAAVEKWTAKTGLAYEVDAGASKTLTLGDIFAAHTSNGQYIAGTVTYNVEGQGDKTVGSSAWSTTQVTFPEGGTYTVTIKDNNYSTTTSATVSITELAPVEKFAVKDDYYFVAHDVVDPGSSNVKTIKLGDIFEASGEGTINSANVTVTTSNKVRKIEATINKNASDWTQTTIDLRYSGEITLTITDGNGCVAASAIVATAPKWVGDVDADDYSDIAQAHYGTKHKIYFKDIQAKDIPLNTKGATGTLTFTIDGVEEGVYGLQWQNGQNPHGSPAGTITVSANGYTSPESSVVAPNWSDKTGDDTLVYLKAGPNTLTFTNVTGNPLVIYDRINIMTLDKSGYEDEDFLPYLKDNSDGEQEGGGDTPTDPSTPTAPSVSWESLGWGGSVKHQPEFDSWAMTHDPLSSVIEIKPGEHYVYTTKSAPYLGVYGMQLSIAEQVNTTVKIITIDGYWNEYEISKSSWTSGMDQDQPIYLHEGANQICIVNTGSKTVKINAFDFGSLNKDGNKGMKYIDIVGTGETFLP